MKYFLFFFLVFNFYNSQVITLFDPETKSIIAYEKVDEYFDGSTLNDQKIDGVIYKKYNNSYYKRVTTSTLSPKNFGAKGNGVYRKSGDINALDKATDDTEAIIKFIQSRKKTNNSGSHLGGSSLYFPQSVYKITGSFQIDDHYTNIFGDGFGASIIHVNNLKNAEKPVFFFKKNESNNAWDSLLSGGGIRDLQLKTDNTSNRQTAILLDYVEYMRFSNLYISGFGKSAIKGSFWESYFDNIKIENCGASQEIDADGNPITGIIDTNANTLGKYSDASNNTLINKLSFSSSGGTLLKFSAAKNTTVNFNINGVYAETYPGDFGMADNLPLVFLNTSRNITIQNGFFTINPTGIKRNGTVFKLDQASELTLSNLNVSLNPIKGFKIRTERRLKNFAVINKGSILNISQSTFADGSDAVGFGLPSVPPLFEGEGRINFNLITLEYLHPNFGGTRRITNIFSRNLKPTGDLLLKPNSDKNYLPAEQQKVFFKEGKITIYANNLPLQIDTWETGDKIEFQNIPSDGSLGKICVKAGTSGMLKNVKADVIKNSNSIKVTDSSHLLIGDWLLIDGKENRILNISGDTIILQNKIEKSGKNISLSFLPPVWKNYGCIVN